MDIAAISNRIDKITHPKWPHWFDISNYESLETLTGEQFINELEARLSLLGTPTLANGRRLTDDKIWQQITLGNVLISQAPALIPDSPAVKPINHIDIEGIREAVRHEYGSDYFSMEPQHLLTVPGISGKQVLLAVDLNLADNNTVLGHIEHKLNQLRKQLAIPEPLTANRDKANEKTFKKLLSYRVIPYLDLLLYSHNHCPLNDPDWTELSFAYSSLINLLFGGDLDGEAFKKTYMSFYRKTTSNDSHMIKLLANIRKNSWALNTRMQNI